MLIKLFRRAPIMTFHLLVHNGEKPQVWKCRVDVVQNTCTQASWWEIGRVCLCSALQTCIILLAQHEKTHCWAGLLLHTDLSVQLHRLWLFNHPSHRSVNTHSSESHWRQVICLATCLLFHTGESAQLHRLLLFKHPSPNLWNHTARHTGDKPVKWNVFKEEDGG